MVIDFFIKRPIFTSVCSFLIILAGIICIPLLPVSQYPELASPSITVSSNYTGASAELVETVVTTPLEQAINGVEGMKYMTSQSSDNGNSTIVVTFELGRDKDIAAVDIQNRISRVEGTLPEDVNRTGVSVSKESTAIISGYSFYAENGEYDNIFISNYIDKYIKDPLKRLPGVGNVFIAGERKYAMRIWVDPHKLAARNLTAADVVTAIREQNVQVPAGQIGQPPIKEGQRFQFSVKVRGRLKSADEFNNIVLKRNDDGSLIKLKDIGHAELGSENYGSTLRYNQKPAVGVLVYQLTDANALEVFSAVEKTMQELRKDFPPGLKAPMAFETTSVVQDSINEVVITLTLAILLVVTVIFLFLQSWRTTIIPVITIPVSLIGTFAVLKLFNFSINTLTMFGLVLATGLVVDDAIVVVENIQRNITEKGLSPMKAASKSMKEVTGALIATTLVLVAVFAPVTGFPGTTGQLYKQFALTIVFSVVISSFNALTLSPALSAVLLTDKPTIFENMLLLRKSREIIDYFRDHYHSLLKRILKLRYLVIAIFIGLLALTYVVYQTVPTAFVPKEDQGYFITSVQAPEGVSLEYTMDTIKKVESMMRQIPEIQNIFAIGGFGFTGNSPNKGTLFATLKPLKNRQGPGQSASAIVQKMNGIFFTLPDAFIVSFEPPAIRGIGSLGGFQFQLIDQGSHTLEELSLAAFQLIGAANQNPVLTGLFTGFNATTPQLEIQIDREKAKSIGVPLVNIFSTLQVYLGSVYVNDFNFLDRVYRVYVQAKMNYRDRPEVINEFYVKNPTTGKNVPLSTLVNINKEYTAQTITHYNMFRSVEINGSSAPGYSSGEALDTMGSLAEKVLPQGMSYRWSGISLEELEAGRQGLLMFALGILLVYLVLAAQYESLVDPLIIIFAVPFAIFGAIIALIFRGYENDVFAQIGLVMLIGLACKNSILIVEFANQLLEEGKKPVVAILEASKTRFRPVLMTSFSFILGIFPLVIASGAGSAGRRSMGTTVFGGMFFSTILSLLIVPVLYLTVKRIFPPKQPAPKGEEATANEI